MYWEQIGFCFFLSGYLMLSIVKSVDKYRQKLRDDRQQLNKLSKTSSPNKISNGDTNHEQETYEILSDFKNKPNEPTNYRIKFIKVIINFNASFNNCFLIVGTLSESYFYGIRMVGNMTASCIGLVYAFIFVLPLMISLKDEIKTPYQYFEKRYGNRTYVRSITALVGLLFYFPFLTLYLYGCSNLISTLIPQLPLRIASIIIGAYSIIGSTIGGFTQSTKTNVVQFLIVISGLMAAIGLTIKRFSESMSLTDMHHFVYINNRTEVINKNIDLTTRYSILNQLSSLSIPWTIFHSLLLPNFIRYRSVKGSALKRRLTGVASAPCFILINSLLLVSGSFMCFLFFYGCDPMSSGKIYNKNQTGPYWIYRVFQISKIPAFTGILFASMMAFSAVQHSLGMSMIANALMTEILNPIILNKLILSQRLVKIIQIILTLLVGMVSISLAYSFQFLRPTVLAIFLLLNNSTHSPLFGLYILSAFNPYANHVGAMTAFVLNLAINYWWSLGSLNIFSHTRSQEYPQTTALCHLGYTFSNLTQASIELDSIQRNITNFNLNDELKPKYYPENQVVYFMYNISSVWYGLWSFLFTFIVGSLLSFIYSLIKTRSFDSDSKFSKERKQYLFFYRNKQL